MTIERPRWRRRRPTCRVGNCGSGIEINADNTMCSCVLGWVVRPCVGANNPIWGGMNTPTCNGPGQSLEIRCSF